MPSESTSIASHWPALSWTMVTSNGLIVFVETEGELLDHLKYWRVNGITGAVYILDFIVDGSDPNASSSESKEAFAKASSNL